MRGSMIFGGRFRNAVLMLADALALVVAWVVCVWVYQAIGLGQYDWRFYLRLWPVVVIFLAFNVLFRLYHGRFFSPGAPIPPVEELRRLVGSALITHMLVIAVIAVVRQTVEDYSRVVMVCSGILTAFLAQPFRDVVRLLMAKLRIGQIPIHLIGDSETNGRFTKMLVRETHVGFKVVGEACEAELAVVSIDPRLLRCRMEELRRRYRYLEYIPSAGVFPVNGAHPVLFDAIGGLEIVNFHQMRTLRLEKWLTDKALSAFACIVSLPLALALAALVKLTSRGPVFYRHSRLGRNGKEIRVWKFRTMYADADCRLTSLLESDSGLRAEWERNRKLAADPRVTPFGRFLRRTSLDEIPQLLNVIAGDMALVGPRPIVQEEVRHYGASYAIMSSVRPGITGLWQCSGRSDVGYARRVALDVHYVLNWSPWLDLWIVIRTVFSVLSMSGAR